MRVQVFLGLISTVFGTDLIVGTTLEYIGSCALGLSLKAAESLSPAMSLLLGDINTVEGSVDYSSVMEADNSKLSAF